MSSTPRYVMSSGGRIWGPYDLATLRSFVAEKRLAHHTLIAEEGSSDFRPALQFAEVRQLFRRAPSARPDVPEATGTSSDLPCFLVVFGRSGEPVRAGISLVQSLPFCHQLADNVFAVKAEGSPDQLRARLGDKLPSTERALVIELGGNAIASHGIALSEHESLRGIFGG